VPESPDAVLARLIEESHRMRPDGLGAHVDSAARGLGADGSRIYVVDLEQTVLLPLPNPACAGEPEPIAVDGTVAGRAFTTGAIVQAPGDGVTVLWVPVLDGTDRLGVLRLDVMAADAPDVAERAAPLAGLVALLLIAKGSYTDAYRRAARTKDLSLAAETQWRQLPPLTLVTGAVSIAGILEPAYELGGDAFDYALNGDRLDLVVVDAMGHGLPAARAAAEAVASIRHSRRRGLDLAATYRAADLTLLESPQPARFVTAILAQMDVGRGVLRWISAGHPRPMLLRERRALGELRCEPSLPLGLAGDVAMVAEAALEPGDQVVLFTDGVTEGRSRGEPFGEDRLAGELEKAAMAGVNPAETVRRAAHAIMEHHDHDLRDDFTIVLVKYRGRG
jgi:hypothetical protein